MRDGCRLRGAGNLHPSAYDDRLSFLLVPIGVRLVAVFDIRKLAWALATIAGIPVAASADGPAFLIEIADTSAYRIGYEQLAALAPALGDVPSDHLRLSTRGEPRHLHVHDGGDGRFGPGDSVSFYGERLHGKQSWFDTYAVNNVYRLDLADQPVVQPDPVRAAAAGAAALRRTLHLEEENLQIRLSNQWVKPDEEPDLWHWTKLTQIDPQPFQASFALPDLAARGDVRIRLSFRGLSEFYAPPGQDKPADHAVDITLNGVPVRTATFDKRNEHAVDLVVPVSRLKPADNVLELRVPQRMIAGQADAMVDVVMFDYVHLDYPIAGDLDDTPLPFTVAHPGSLVLEAEGEGDLVLYGRDGSRTDGELRDGRWHFERLALGDYQPVLQNRYGAPAALRPAPAARWRDVEAGYDYLLIAHPSLLAASRPLADYHRDRGLRVAEIDVTDLYAEFNDGIVHPRAIRDFVAHAYQDWPAPRPRFVLLVGDASFDVRSDRAEDARYAKWANRELLIPGQFGEIDGGEYEGTDKLAARRNLIPTWQYPSEEGHSAADNYFVAVDGDDWLPDLALGRFPVVEPDEVAAIVAKTIRYLDEPDFGDWRRRTLFATDTNTYFQSESTRIASLLEDEGFSADKVYPTDQEADNEAHIATLKNAFNEGQLLVHFVGHGGRYIWRTGPPDLTKNHDLFTLDHVAQLQNGHRLPMVLSMTCYSAPFDHPSADSIGERFLREADKGAIAVFAASWRNTPVPAFSQAAIEELMTPGAAIGEALMRAKRTLDKPWSRTLVETYNLLGDPAVVLQRPSLPLKLQARTRGDRPIIDIRIEDADVNGRATIEWRAEDGTVLARRWREMRGRFAAVAVPAVAQDAREVQLHLVDYAGRRDGLARLVLDSGEDEDEAPAAAAEPAPPSAPVTSTAADAVQPRSAGPVTDRIVKATMESNS